MTSLGRLLPAVSTSRPALAYRNDGQLRPATAIYLSVLDECDLLAETPIDWARLCDIAGTRSTAMPSG